MEMIKLTHRSVHCYLIKCEIGWIMVDAWWPSYISEFLHMLQQRDIHKKDIKYIVVTHFHPDHAGLVQEIKDFGAEFIVHQCQVPLMQDFEKSFKPQQNFTPITADHNRIVTSEESRAWLSQLGIKGELLETPGHSEDSISLVIDGCCAFTGDLSPLFAAPEGESEIKSSWRKLQKLGVKQIYGGHGEVLEI